MGIPSSIPAPPFSAPAPAGPRDPYSGVSASQAPVAARPAAIRVEMDAEVAHAQQRGRKKVMVLAGVTALIGAIIGIGIGDGMQRQSRQEVALDGAQALVKEIDEANTQIEQLSEVLSNAKQKLASNKFPQEELTKLGAINIPFEGSNLATKGIGLFQSDVVTMLINYASGTSDANRQKEKLQRILGGSKKAIQDFLKQQTDPKVGWSVVVTSSPFGPWAAMQPLPKPFELKGKDGWPKEFKIAQGGKTVKLDRYMRGDPTKSDDPEAIPVDPATQVSVCPSDTLLKLRREIGKLDEVLKGDKTPGHETDGLLDLGNRLKDKLKLIGGSAA